MSMTQDFRAHLTRQLRLMALSCESYDAGYQDEAIRIAQSLRILLHDTKRQTSLVSHLNARGINLATTVEPLDTSRSVMLSGMGSFLFNSQGVSWRPALGTHHLKAHIPIEDWWQQTVYIHGSVRLTRCSLVLNAADKDGGAHVDPTLSVEYESLMNKGGIGFYHISLDPEGRQSIPITDAHFVYLRQIGFEVLNSPELLALAG
jgi:hypothetical protein